jgi:hypothetical protein
MARKTKTPRSVSILRKLYTYLGASGLFTAISGKFGIDSETMILIVELYLMGQIVIQVICDAYFFKEPETKTYPKEKL